MKLEEIAVENEYIQKQVNDMLQYREELQDEYGREFEDEEVIEMWGKYRSKEFHDNYCNDDNENKSIPMEKQLERR